MLSSWVIFGTCSSSFGHDQFELNNIIISRNCPRVCISRLNITMSKRSSTTTSFHKIINSQHGVFVENNLREKRTHAAARAGFDLTQYLDPSECPLPTCLLFLSPPANPACMQASSEEDIQNKFCRIQLVFWFLSCWSINVTACIQVIRWFLTCFPGISGFDGIPP